MREGQPEEPDEESDGDEEETDEQTASAPTRAGSNVQNAGRDPAQDRALSAG
jgi:hypothetical protein